MGEIKTDLFPGHLSAVKEREKENHQHSSTNAVTPEEPLPESKRPRKDGPGGE